jgi:hypothetical protein
MLPFMPRSCDEWLYFRALATEVGRCVNYYVISLVHQKGSYWVVKFGCFVAHTHT